MEEKNISMEQPNAVNAQVAEAKLDEKADTTSGLNVEKSGEGFSADGSIGKFKNTESLYSAYNNLQAEFTRKCQKLSELEQSLQKPQDVEAYLKDNPLVVEEILKKYIQELKQNSAPITISSAVGSGIPLMAPPKPTTLDEAREAVKNLFK